MNEGKTLIQNLDAEHQTLEKLRSELDDEVTRLCGDDEKKVPWEVQLQINDVRRRFDEASTRRDEIEDFVGTRTPHSRDDVYILLRLGFAIAKDHRQDRFEGYQRDIILPRIIAEVAAFLMAEAPPKREFSIGDNCLAWDDDCKKVA